MRPSFRSADRHSRGRPRRRPAGPYRYVRLRWRVLFTCLDWLGWMLVRAVRGAKERLGLALADTNGDPERILLVQLDHLGDAIISTVMFPLLRQRYPHARIEVLAGAWNREVFAALPEVDDVFVSRVNRFARKKRFLWLPSLFWWAWRLRARRYDLAIDIRGEFPLALLLRMTGAQRRLGWDCGGGGFLLTESPRFSPRRPEVASRLALLAELEIEPGAATSAGPRLEAADAARRGVLRRLAEVASPARPLIVVHLGAGTSAKRWPLDSWQTLVGRLIANYRAQIAVVGGISDRPLAAELIGRFSAADVSDWTGALKLAESAALVEQADLFLGADSGPAHLAAAVGTPVVALFSGTNDSCQWRPWGEHVLVVRHEVACSPCHRTECFWADHPCMRGLGVAAVLHAVAQLWDSVVAPRCRGWQPSAPPSMERSMSIRPPQSHSHPISRVEGRAR